MKSNKEKVKRSRFLPDKYKDIYEEDFQEILERNIKEEKEKISHGGFTVKKIEEALKLSEKSSSRKLSRSVDAADSVDGRDYFEPKSLYY